MTLTVPAWLHLILWPALLVWTALLIGHRRDWAWVRSRWLVWALVPAVFAADVAAIVASHDWPARASTSFVLSVVWLAWALSVTGYLVLRAPGRDEPGGDADDPEPPWWPDFERQFRDYERGRSRTPHRPRTPAGAL